MTSPAPKPLPEPPELPMTTAQSTLVMGAAALIIGAVHLLERTGLRAPLLVTNAVSLFVGVAAGFFIEYLAHTDSGERYHQIADHYAALERFFLDNPELVANPTIREALLPSQAELNRLRFLSGWMEALTNLRNGTPKGTTGLVYRGPSLTIPELQVATPAARPTPVGDRRG